MPRNGSGVFTVINSFTPSTVIASSQMNANFTDVATALTQSVATTGVSAMAANLPMGNNRITGLAQGTAGADAVNKNQLDVLMGGLTTAGSAGTYTLTSGTSITTLADGLMVVVRINATNAGASTLNVDGLGAKAIRYQYSAGDNAVYAGALSEDALFTMVYSESANSAAGAWIVLNPATVRGTWTPITVGTTTTYGVDNGGWYRRERDMVTFGGIFQINSIGDGDPATMSGLPYNAKETGPITVSFYANLATSVVNVGGSIQDATPLVNFVAATAAAVSLVTVNILQNSSIIHVAGSYPAID